MLWELLKSFAELLLFGLFISAILARIRNTRIRDGLAAIAAVLGLLWLLFALTISSLTNGSLLVVIVFVLLIGLMFLIHYGYRALSRRARTPRA